MRSRTAVDWSQGDLLSSVALSGFAPELEEHKSVHVQLNGNDVQVEDGLTVRQLLDGADPAYLHGLVEVNGVYLPRERYCRLLVEGDRIEVILPAFGG